MLRKVVLIDVQLPPLAYCTRNASLLFFGCNKLATVVSSNTVFISVTVFLSQV